MSKLTAIDRIIAWASRRRDNALMKRFGGIQRCPWCRQVAQTGEGWNFTEWRCDPFLDVLECGVCKGKSLWLWGHGFHYVGTLTPPVTNFTPMDGYDIAGRLALQQEGNT